MRMAAARVGIVALALLWAGAAWAQQDLGHRLAGTLGLDAGRLAPPGIHAADRLVIYRADRLRDRNGDRVPLDVNLDTVGNAVGAAASFDVPALATRVTVAFGLPIARVAASVGELQASVDKFGLSDIFVQPLKLGWRFAQVDVVTGYALYIPTGDFEPGARGGVSSGQFTHQLSLGGTAFFDRARTAFVTALASYDLNQRKRNIDLTRGDDVQAQGGVGLTLRKVIDLGVAAYVLKQVRDDRGSALPPRLRGARDFVWGLGPEADVTVPYARTRVGLRAEWDVATRSRPQGFVMVLGVTVQALSFP
jgi:hypothetical protein